MDWGADADYTQDYAGTFRTPMSADSDGGIYLLDEAGREPESCGRHPIREKYYTGGNINNGSAATRRYYDVAYDERPPRYGSGPLAAAYLLPPPLDMRGKPAFPNSPPPEWTIDPDTHQLPTAPSKECPGGGRSLDRFTAGGAPPATQAPTAASPAPTTVSPALAAVDPFQCLKVVLLIAIVLLLAMILMTTSRLARDLERAAQSAVELLGAVGASSSSS